MVVFHDLDDDTLVSRFSRVKPVHHSLAPLDSDNDDSARRVDGRPNPNINGFSAALSCYPIVRQLASELDLNTLHDLSRTCRQFRANLLEYRDQLVKHTLRCANEDAGVGSRLADRLRESSARFGSARQLTSGKVGRCARDMVGECRRCGTVVCRNCTTKPPRASTLRARHRRLCRTCSKAPLYLLTTTRRPRSNSASASSPPSTPDSVPVLVDNGSHVAFTSEAFERTPCCCPDMVWLCTACGQNLSTPDSTYVRAWNWRTRYSHYLGGVGTGAGEGNEGVECGRGPNCLAARTVEHEIDYDSSTLEPLEGYSVDRWKGTSYHAQEIEGVGGVFKLKAKKQVRVGECVKIYEDEKAQQIKELGREASGKLRSWCAWCERVILGEKDLAALAS